MAEWTADEAYVMEESGVFLCEHLLFHKKYVKM